MGRVADYEDGKRYKITLFGEDNYYIIATRAEDGGFDFMATVPDQNSPEMMRERQAVDALCDVMSRATREI